MLVDQATIFVRSGKGGDGHVSFRRQKYIPKGGPDGGDGGDGGSVILVATRGVDTLLDFSGRHHWNAKNGQPGGPKQCHGAKGDDLEIQVPLGTIVYDEETETTLADLSTDGQRLIAVVGGRGGFGNEHFKSPTYQTPREFTPGEQAQQKTLRLELKLIADLGLIGKPNVGKSTLLSQVSNARPKIGNYPFTTLRPNLGIARLRGDRRLVVADIPGLIEGASDGHGLGNQFLRHIERTRCLVHVLGWDPLLDSPSSLIAALEDDYQMIRKELAGYSVTLVNKPQILVLNKTDLAVDEHLVTEVINALEASLGQRPMTVSGATGKGVNTLLEACWELVNVSKLNNNVHDGQEEDSDRDTNDESLKTSLDDRIKSLPE